MSWIRGRRKQAHDSDYCRRHFSGRKAVDATRGSDIRNLIDDTRDLTVTAVVSSITAAVTP